MRTARVTLRERTSVLARVQAGSTAGLPGYVNNVDSLWETKGLRNDYSPWLTS